MARDPKTLDRTSIDLILKSLTNRPNVESVLILSRKDGSIIQATGFSEGETAGAVNNRFYDSNQPSEAHHGSAQDVGERLNGMDDTDEQQIATSPAQRLAASIYEFVNASSRLAVGLSRSKTNPTIANTDVSANSGGRSAEQGANGSAVTDEEDVQLLRMRTRGQEVIIFPDSNYLGCVIQNLSRTTTGRYEPT